MGHQKLCLLREAPEVQPHQEPDFTLCRHEMIPSRSLGALRLRATSTSWLLRSFYWQELTTKIKMQPDTPALNGCWPLRWEYEFFSHIPDHNGNTFDCVAQPSENVVCSVVLLSLQGEAYLPYLGKHQVSRDLIVRAKNVKCHSGICPNSSHVH